MSTPPTSPTKQASGFKFTANDANDEKNILELGTACPVATQHLLDSPLETANWLTLKEGYLLKTKVKKLHKSTKLRLFVLKQDPYTLASCLEYYEGRSIRGSAVLVNARIHPEKAGVFLVHTADRTFILQAERGDLLASVSWVLALQQAIQGATKAASFSSGSSGGGATAASTTSATATATATTSATAATAATATTSKILDL